MSWYPNGDPIRMTTDSLGMPLLFIWRGKRHPVIKVTKPWQIDVNWWRGRVWRQYFKLVTRTGLLVEVFHDLIGGGWYVQRRYD